MCPCGCLQERSDFHAGHERRTESRLVQRWEEQVNRPDVFMTLRRSHVQIKAARTLSGSLTTKQVRIFVMPVKALLNVEVCQ